MRKLLAEAIGTFWLVLGGCGAALVAAGLPDVGIGYGVSALCHRDRPSAQSAFRAAIGITASSLATWLLCV